ncbi:pilus assembly protein PilM [Myxococcota bacterium]|nr:pilus assembly protein PilM [Myxococcota bacterium]
MPQKVLGIDLGSWSVKAVLLETSFRNLDVAAVREVKLPPGDPSTKAERQAEALRALLEDGTLRADFPVAGFPGELTTTRFVSLPFADPKRIEQTMAGELADTIPFELDDAVFDHALLKKSDDGTSLSVAAIAMRESVARQLQLLQAEGLDPKFLPADVFQLYNLYSHFLREDASKAEAPSQASADAGTFIAATPDGPPDARLVVDIGHERTLVAAAGADGIAYVRVIRFGGRDVTDAIAKAYGLSWEDAEEGKHADALVASARHPAPSDAAQRMSDVVSEGLQPLLRELRRTLQAIRGDKRVRVARVDLLGGGSRIRNLPNYLAEELNVPVAAGAAVEQAVERQIDGPRRPAYALALALALRGSADDSVSKVDLRVGELAYAGQLRHLRDRLPFLVGSAAMVLVLLGVNTWAQFHVISRREAAIDKQFCEITQKVLGKEVCEPTVAISMMREPASELGAFKLPERSAFRTAADVSNLIPPNTDITVSELEVTPDRLRISGDAASFDAVDQIVAEYSKDECLTEIKKSKLHKKSDGKGVEFQLSIKLRCS